MTPDEVHLAAQYRIAEATATALDTLIRTLPDPLHQAGMLAYNAGSVPLIAGAQRTAAQVALGYLANRIGTTGPAELDRALRDVLVTGASNVAVGPILRLWRATGEGADLAEAIDQASSQASNLASEHLHAAQRAGLDEGARIGEQRVENWSKLANAHACEWCASIAGEGPRFDAAADVPSHAACRCSVVPAVA